MASKERGNTYISLNSQGLKYRISVLLSIQIAILTMVMLLRAKRDPYVAT